MDDLVRVATHPGLDPVSAAGLVHAQFETIHPYGDGNGRLGRVHIGWVLIRHAGVVVPPPVSVLMARDVGGYLSGLTRYRQGDVSGWVGWMAEALTRSADQVVVLVGRAEELRRGWDDLLTGVRSDAAARRLLDVVVRQLVVTAPMVGRSARRLTAGGARCHRNARRPGHPRAHGGAPRPRPQAAAVVDGTRLGRAGVPRLIPGSAEQWRQGRRSSAM
jgi:hypothetical protein